MLSFTITFDFIDHMLRIVASDGAQRAMPLHDGLSVAGFYDGLLALLKQLGIEVSILTKPFDNPSTIPFPEDTTHSRYDAEAVGRYHQVLLGVNAICQDFAGRFYGKSSPVHLFWHSFDLAVTRFSGRSAPDLPDADPVTCDAYSHEDISFAWWAGDPQTPFPAFYAYTYPEPENLAAQLLQPGAAFWQPSPRPARGGAGLLAKCLRGGLPFRRMGHARPGLSRVMKSACQY